MSVGVASQNIESSGFFPNAHGQGDAAGAQRNLRFADGQPAGHFEAELVDVDLADLPIAGTECLFAVAAGLAQWARGVELTDLSPLRVENVGEQAPALVESAGALPVEGERDFGAGPGHVSGRDVVADELHLASEVEVRFVLDGFGQLVEDVLLELRVERFRSLGRSLRGASHDQAETEQ
jgi:hypothetical protein